MYIIISHVLHTRRVLSSSTVQTRIDLTNFFILEKPFNINYTHCMNNDCFSARTILPLAASECGSISYMAAIYYISCDPYYTHSHTHTHTHTCIYILYRVLAKIMVHPNDKARTLALALAAASRSRENFKFLARPGLCIISGIRYFDKLSDNLLNLPQPVSPRSTRTHT